MRNLTVGLLVDLYQPQLPWRLQVGDGDEWDIGDTFLNGVKEVSPWPTSPRRPPDVDGAVGDGWWAMARPGTSWPGPSPIQGVVDKLGRPRLTI